MAKKNFNVTSTLGKAKISNPEPELSSKIELRKNTKNLEDVKEKVDSLHSAEITPVQKLTTEVAATPEKVVAQVAIPVEEEKIKPNSRTRYSKKEQEKPVESEKLVRLTIDTPAEMHTKLKVKSVLSGISMRDYILQLLEKELKKG